MLRLDCRKATTFCHGSSRRDFMHVGSLAFLGACLSGRMALEAKPRQSGKTVESCILLYLVGGPPQLDTWDMKPHAPVEFRGPYRPVATNVPGIQISQLFPRMARQTDKLALVRSFCHTNPSHPRAAIWVQTGRPPVAGIRYPHVGCVVEKLKPASGDLPAHVLLPYKARGSQSAGFLGKLHQPFVVDSDPSDSRFQVRDLLPPDNVSTVRVNRRRSFRTLVDDAFQKFEEGSAEAKLIDSNFAQAYQIISSAEARQAFELDREPEKVRGRYGTNRFGQSCLLARRLVERGVRFVTVNMFDDFSGSWDIHGQAPFAPITGLNNLGPMLDNACASLIEDLHDRGMLEQTMVVVFGEFGRSPRVNPSGGRDHWPGCGSMIFAGGGVAGGQVIGASDRTASEPTDRPVSPEEILATIYHALGISLHTDLPGPGARPVPIVEIGVEPVQELFA